MSRFNEDKAVACLAEIIALECGIHSSTAKRLRTAAALHDIGKIKLPDSILNKPNSLTEQEFEIVKTHTRLGADILASIQGELGVMARNICEFHHEHWDGGGYWGKYTCELPSYVAITSIADIFVALTSERPYKHAWPPKDALEYINNQAGKQFSPVLVKLFIPLVRNDSRVTALFDGR